MFTTKRLVLIISLAALAVLLVACGERTEPTPTPVPPTATPAPATATPMPPTATPEPTATPTPLSAQAILQAAYDSQQTTPYSIDLDMTLVLSGPDIGDDIEIAMRLTGVVEPPDRMKGTLLTSSQGMDAETELVVIGEESFVLNPLTSRWQRDVQSGTMFDPADLVMDPADFEELELVGQETLDDAPVYYLSGRAALPFNLGEPLGEMNADMRIEYWISQDDLTIVRSTSEGDMDFGGMVDASATVSMTARMFDYGIPVDIVAPEIASSAVISVANVGVIAIEPALLAPLTDDTPEGNIQRGLESLVDGRIGLAFAHFDRALTLRPDWPDAMLYRGATLAIDGSIQEALANIDAAIEAEPDRADAYALRAWTYLRAAVRQLDDFDDATALEKAAEDIAKALELAPDMLAAQGLQGAIDLNEALALFETDETQATADFQAAMVELQLMTTQDLELGSRSIHRHATDHGSTEHGRPWLAVAAS